MDKNQFRVLYKQFLFRVVDLEILSTSARGDASRLLGQFGTILVFVSSGLALLALFILGAIPRAPAQRLAFVWGMEQFLIATTMLVVGLFGVLSWDSIFPDRRDVLILLPLSVRVRTLFFAKIAAVGAALGLAIAALHCFAGLLWPLVLAREQNFLGLVRSFAAYCITMLAAGAFIFCCLLCIQGVATLLPRRLFLRLSALLQLVAFWLFLTVYFLHPTMTAPQALTTPANHTLLACVPIYWFFGLFQILEGSSSPALTALASRAALGLVIAVLGTCVAFLLSYLRTLRKTVEEPDITPGTGGGHRLPPFGKRPLTAIVQFTIRTLFRSRQHRLILSFFLGFGFTVVALYLKTPIARGQLLVAPGISSWRTVNAPLIVSSIVIMLLAVIGMRMAFAMPTDLPANWVFRLTTTSAVSDYLKAVRRSLLVLAVAPVWILCAGVFFWLWPLRPALEHLGVLALLGMILVEACLWGFHKVPFTCSYLPGKAKVEFVLPAVVLTWVTLGKATQLEQYALQNQTAYAIVISVLAIAAILLRWGVVASSRSEGAEVRFEELEPPVILELRLLAGGAPRTQPPAT